MNIDNFVIYLIIIIFLIIIVININNNIKKDKKDKKDKKEFIIIKNTNTKEIPVYEEIINGGITNINYHCKITMNNIYIFNEHHGLINKSLINKSLINKPLINEPHKIVEIINNLKDNDSKDLLVISSSEDHIGDYEILNHIIKVNGIKIDYKKLDLMAHNYEKYKKIKMLIDTIKIYTTHL
jgi:hypothetical protein